MTASTVVVGSYPPIPVPGATASRAEVRRLLAAGAEVAVVAPRLSASHLVVPVTGLLSGRRLGNVRRVTGARRLVLVVEDGYPLPRRSALGQAATAAALVPAMRAFEHVRIVRAGPTSIDDRVWSRLVAAADETARVEAEPAPPGVTPLGPAEQPAGARAVDLGRRVAKRLLGTRAPAVRALLARVRRPLRPPGR